MTFKYEYICPLSKGFTRIKVKRENNNLVFKYKKRTFLNDLLFTTEYYENHECIQVQRVPSVLNKVLLLLLSPVIILYYGIGNEDTYDGIKRVLFAKKYGAFTSDCIYNKDDIKMLKGEK